jgi:hypothetical protein
MLHIISDSSLHRWRHGDRLMHADEGDHRPCRVRDLLSRPFKKSQQPIIA